MIIEGESNKVSCPRMKDQDQRLVLVQERVSVGYNSSHAENHLSLENCLKQSLTIKNKIPKGFFRKTVNIQVPQPGWNLFKITYFLSIIVVPEISQN